MQKKTKMKYKQLTDEHRLHLAILTASSPEDKQHFRDKFAESIPALIAYANDDSNWTYQEWTRVHKPDPLSHPNTSLVKRWQAELKENLGIRKKTKPKAKTRKS